jgi:hypothetical protein
MMTFNRPNGHWAAVALLSLSSVALVECSDDGQVVVGTVLPNGGGGSTGWIVGDLDGGLSSEASCGESLVLQPLTPVFYLVVDRSTAMQQQSQQQGSKWSDLVPQLRDYFTMPAQQNSIFGLGYMPNPCQFRIPNPINCTSGNMMACLPDAYSTPNVPLGAAGSAIADYVVNSPGPMGPTAMRLALDGAVHHVIPDWEKLNQNQDKFGVVVLIAGDQQPDTNDCNNSAMGGIAAAVDTTPLDPMFPNAHTRTFVLGFETGSNANPLDQIASHGGTDSALAVGNNGNNGNNNNIQPLSSRLNEVRNKSCMFRLPPGIGRDASLSVVYPPAPEAGTDDGGSSVHDTPDTVGGVRNRGECYNDNPEFPFNLYIDPDDPTLAIGCDQLCVVLAANPGAQLRTSCSALGALTR